MSLALSLFCNEVIDGHDVRVEKLSSGKFKLHIDGIAVPVEYQSEDAAKKAASIAIKRIVKSTVTNKNEEKVSVQTVAREIKKVLAGMSRESGPKYSVALRAVKSNYPQAKELYDDSGLERQIRAHAEEMGVSKKFLNAENEKYSVTNKVDGSMVEKYKYLDSTIKIFRAETKLSSGRVVTTFGYTIDDMEEDFMFGDKQVAKQAAEARIRK